jgi:hypothetical protein
MLSITMSTDIASNLYTKLRLGIISSNVIKIRHLPPGGRIWFDFLAMPFETKCRKMTHSVVEFDNLGLTSVGFSLLIRC